MSQQFTKLIVWRALFVWGSTLTSLLSADVKIVSESRVLVKIYTLFSWILCHFKIVTVPNFIPSTLSKLKSKCSNRCQQHEFYRCLQQINDISKYTILLPNQHWNCYISKKVLNCLATTNFYTNDKFIHLEYQWPVFFDILTHSISI